MRILDCHRTDSAAFGGLGSCAGAADRSRPTGMEFPTLSNVLETSRLWREVVNELIPREFPKIEVEHLLVDGGSMGMLPYASLNDGTVGLYEPIHGSARDIAGQNKANPCGTILSAAMLLRHSLGLEPEAKAGEDAVTAVLRSGLRTGDIAEKGATVVGTIEMGTAIATQIANAG